MLALSRAIESEDPAHDAIGSRDGDRFSALSMPWKIVVAVLALFLIYVCIVLLLQVLVREQLDIAVVSALL